MESTPQPDAQPDAQPNAQPDAQPDAQPSAASPGVPAPLPYHLAIRDHFKTREPKLWQWFHERESPEALRENVRLELLKTSVRLEREDHASVYDLAGLVARRLGLSGDERELPITLYQGQGQSEMNAALLFVPGEVHLMLHGPILERLSESELTALLGHELTHYSVFAEHEGELYTTLAIIDALTAANDVEFAQLATARFFDLYCEILCDRGALKASGDHLAVVSTLVKTSTGLVDVNPEAYLRQAEEIFAKGKVMAEGGTHPESFVRARAIERFANVGVEADDELRTMIEGELELDALDILGQVSVSGRTRRLIAYLLADEACRGKAQLAQAHLYFDDFELMPQLDGAALASDLASGDAALRDYYCYVVVDFAAADREDLDAVLARGLALFAQCALDERLAELAGKELGLKKNELEKIRSAAAAVNGSAVE